MTPVDASPVCRSVALVHARWGKVERIRAEQARTTLPRQTLPPQGAHPVRDKGIEEIIMQRVFVLSSDRQPLDPCHPARARRLLSKGRAAVIRRFPFNIILKECTAEDSVTHPHRLKID